MNFPKNSRVVAKAHGPVAQAPTETVLPSLVDSKKQLRARTYTRLRNNPRRRDIPDSTQYPWNSIGAIGIYLNRQHQGTATGFLIKPDVLVTAAHVIERQHDAIGVWIGVDARSNPNVRPNRVSAFAIHASFDVAVLILEMGLQHCFNVSGLEVNVGAQVSLAGYGIAYDDGSIRESYDDGRLNELGNGSIRYSISTNQGDSGSPVFVIRGGQAVAVGIHGDPANDFGNGGVFISDTLLSDFAIMEREAREYVR